MIAPEPTRVLHASRIESECMHRDHMYATGDWLQPPRGYFLRGTAVHAARQYALAHYMEAGDLPPVDECQQAAASAAEERVALDGERGVAPLSPEEFTAAVDVALPLVEADRTLLLPRLAPHVLAVEETLTADLGGGWSLSGTLDARGSDPSTGTGILHDLKTAEKSPGSNAETAAALSLQLSAYSLLHRLHHGTIPLLALQYVWRMKRGPKAETIQRDGLLVTDLEGGGVGVARILTAHRSAADLDAALLRLRARVDMEEGGWYAPAFSGFLSPCSRCAHWGHEDPSMRCGYVPSVRPSKLEVCDES